MSIAQTKQHLINLLRDRSNTVIALSGDWGSGKTHLWREAKAEMTDSSVGKALETSLFGLSDVAEVKSKLVQAASGADPSLLSKGTHGYRALMAVLKEYHGAFAALSDIALAAAPFTLKDRFIVLDDIERRHPSLGIEAILGFIDEFSQHHGARFLLILNSDQQEQREDWERLREKVIDQELRLETLPAEAFGIAIKDMPSPHAQAIGEAVDICGLTNIRIVKKIIKVVNRIVPPQAPPAVVTRTVPSAVLLAAIHFKGLQDGPSMDFLLTEAGQTDWRDFLLPGDPFQTAAGPDDERAAQEKRRRETWRGLLAKLRIGTADEYEHLLVAFLRAGLVDDAKLAAVIERYTHETDRLAKANAVQDFIFRNLWDHRPSDAELLAQAEALVYDCANVSAGSLTSLHETVSALPGGADVAERMLQHWLTNWQQALRHNEESILASLEYPHTRAVLPQIQAALDDFVASAYARGTVREAVATLLTGKGHPPRAQAVLRRASVADMEAAIWECSPDELRLFMRKMLELHKHRHAYQADFGTAMEHFMQACENIIKAGTHARLASILKAALPARS